MSDPNPYEGPKLVIDNDKLGESAPNAPLKGSGGRGTFDGMDGWQISVEARLGAIQTDIRDLRAGVGDAKLSLATLTERVAHLPSKGFIVKALLASLAVIAALIAFQSHIQAILR